MATGQTSASTKSGGVICGQQVPGDLTAVALQEERRTRSLSLSLLYPSRLTHSTHTNYPTRSSTSSPHLITSPRHPPLVAPRVASGASRPSSQCGRRVGGRPPTTRVPSTAGYNFSLSPLSLYSSSSSQSESAKLSSAWMPFPMLFSTGGRSAGCRGAGAGASSSSSSQSS